MNKHRRNELKQLKYRKRIRRWINANRGIYRKDGNWVGRATTEEAVNLNVQTIFKSTSTPCSCYMCSGAWKYERHKFKRETEKLLKEEIEPYL